MIVTYAPKDGDAQTWTYRPDDISNFEAEAIERRTEWTWGEYLQALQKGSTLAKRATLWTLLRRDHKTLRFEDVAFTQSEVEISYELDEMQNMRDAVASAPDQPGMDKDSVLSIMDSEIAKLTTAGVEEPGKAPAPTGDAVISTP